MSNAKTIGRKPVHKFDLDGYGTLYLKRLSHAQAREVVRKYEAVDKNPDAPGNPDGWLLAITLCDESGKLLYSGSDADDLADADVEFVTLVCEEVIRVNQLNRKGVAALGKDSPPTTTGDSSSA